MRPVSVRTLRRPAAGAALVLCAALSALAGLAAFTAHAQQIYKSVGPDGRVTYSDKPAAGTAASVPASGAGDTGGTPASALPFELRQVAARYPVMLYTGEKCDPCKAARDFLNARGIPFSEKSVTSNDDIETLQRLTGATNIPSGSVGGQVLRGFSDLEWARLLDAAGYPATSLLPAGYRQAPVTPLVIVTRAVPAARPAASAPARADEAAPPPAPPASSASNPAGIRF